MNEEKILTDAEKLQASKKMDEVFDTTSDMVLSDFAKIVGRDLTDEEKKTLGISLRSYFLITSLMMSSVTRW